MSEPERVTVPLVMLAGNMQVLLDHKVPCAGISLRRYGPEGVILVLHSEPEHKEAWKALGFQTTDYVEGDDE